MLRIVIPGREFWDEKSESFTSTKATTLTMEHSLIAISKWESIWHKPFLSKAERTQEETLSYIKCMIIGEVPSDMVLMGLPNDSIQKIQDYIADPMTASTVKADRRGNNGEAVTSELIYYWMTALQIPFECQKWHLNRLMMLIQICNAKQQPGKKMPKKDMAKRNHSLNAARRATHHSHG